MISSYVTDTTSGGYHYNFKYDGKKLVEIRASHPDPFGFGRVEDVMNISYNADNKLNSIGNASGENPATRFNYGADGNLSTKISYSRMPFPMSKTEFEWKDGRISRVKRSDYEVKGSPDKIENYTEKLTLVLDLEYDEKGNVIYVKRTAYPDIVTEIRYDYDSHPNPNKTWHELQGGSSSEFMYLLSTNNMTRASYLFVKEQFREVHDSHYQYNDKSYPLNGAFNNRMLEIQYQCR
ncbi:hypothetical protein LZG74_07325 [Dyadobacter sp. CY327]|uniref:hypothetical protein n=1 Tax=Dyadobacter sp. CY327 TaxID=2907301 RepID=UPI001F1B9601|nr:hypothetical protein [Dyadobacter sp. CY327]MCE7070104.1 hypothetical protein [Dyadobacter sp. CY327]